MERSVALIAIFAALIAALGFFPQIMLATGVPITMQSLGIMLCGTILGAKRGALAVLLFLVLVALGLPLLAGGRGGLGVFAGPTVGFLVGFPIAAFVTGWIMERTAGWPVVMAGVASAVIGGIVVLYFFGFLGFMLMTGSSLIKSVGILGVFVPGDIIKAVLAGLITAGLAKARPASVLSRA